MVESGFSVIASRRRPRRASRFSGHDVKAGRLMHIRPSWTLPAGGIHAVYPAALRVSKVTAFMAMLTEEHKRIALDQTGKAAGPPSGTTEMVRRK